MPFTRVRRRPCRPARATDLRTALLVVLTVLLASTAVLAQDVTPEYRLKAAFVHQLPQFVEWPAGALDGRPSLDLCVLTSSRFRRVLEELVDGETLAGRPVAVRRVHLDESIRTCHVLFLPSASTARVAALRQVATAAVLTVSDASRFLDEGGVVQLRVVDDRVRFEVNARAARRAGLRLSSQLLQLAASVRGWTS